MSKEGDFPVREQLYQVMKVIDSKLCDGDFGHVDNVLKYLIVESLDTSVMLSYATITLAANHELKERDTFMVRVRRILEKRYPDRVDALLRGLEPKDGVRP